MIAKCCADAKEKIVFREDLQDWYLYHYLVNFPVNYCPWCGSNTFEEPLTWEKMLELIPQVPNGETFTVTFDVDGVIAFNGHPYDKCKACEPTIEILKELKKKGYTIILQTARYMKVYDNDQEKAASRGTYELYWWCKENGVPFDRILLGKASSDLYIDDKGCRVEAYMGQSPWLENFFPILKMTFEERFKQEN